MIDVDSTRSTVALWFLVLVLSTSAFAAETQPASPAAPIDVLIFSDFECPYCARAATQLREIEEANGGRIRMHFKHTPLDFHKRAPLAHKAAIAAAEQGKFREMHDAIFQDQQLLDRRSLIKIAKGLKLDAARFARAIDSKRVAAVLEQDQREAAALGVGGRPTMFVGGQRVVGAVGTQKLQQAVDAAAGAISAEPEKPALTGPPSLDQAPIRGAVGAPVTITVFSDFECPFCGRFNDTLEALRQQYPGQIRIAFKHFPLSFHANAPLAHKAALAAGEQGKFWDMHDRLFRQQRSLKKEDLLLAGQELGLDVERFRSDLESDRWKASLDADTQQGSKYGVTGTPTFFVNGRMLSGALPIDQLRTVVEQELKALVAPVAP